jgi:hypothetical protein
VPDIGSEIQTPKEYLTIMSMEDLLQAILGGAGAQMPSKGAQGSNQQDPLAEILGGILGGGAQQQQQSSGGRQGTGDIGDIIGQIFGGAQQQQQSSAGQQGTGDIGDIIGQIFGGAQRQQQSSAGQQGTGDIGDIIGQIFGGAQRQQQPAGGTQQGGGIGDILGGILGGGANMKSNTFLGPIVEKLAEQLGLPPAIAQMVVSFILNKMMSGAAAGTRTPSQRTPSQVLPSQRPSQQPAQAQQGMNLDDLLEQMSAGQTLDTGYLNKTGMTSELSLQTGMDPNTAAMSLQQAFKLLGGALGTSQQTGRTGATTTQRKSSKSSKTSSRKRSKPKQEWTV